MRATCPTCATAYTIPDDRIGPKGRKVRCTRCGGEWRVVLEGTVATEVDEESFVADAHVEPPAIEDTPLPPAVAVAAEVPEPPAAPPRTAVDEPTPAAIRAAPARRRRRKWHPRLPRMPIFVTRCAPFVGPLVFVTAVLVVTGMLVFRAAVVATLPGLAGLYAAIGFDVNVRGLTFGPIATLREVENGQPVLVVEGTLANPTAENRDVPALRFALRDADAQELYAWSVDPHATTISAGDRLRFRTRLVAPPDRAADLQVRFVERRNREARLP